MANTNEQGPIKTKRAGPKFIPVARWHTTKLRQASRAVKPDSAAIEQRVVDDLFNHQCKLIRMAKAIGKWNS
jgi:hypothetical protein